MKKYRVIFFVTILSVFLHIGYLYAGNNESYSLFDYPPEHIVRDVGIGFTISGVGTIIFGVAFAIVVLMERNSFEKRYVQSKTSEDFAILNQSYDMGMLLAYMTNMMFVLAVLQLSIGVPAFIIGHIFLKKRLRPPEKIQDIHYMNSRIIFKTD